MELSKCFTCGRGFTGDTNQALQYFKRLYEEHGIERYFYKLSEKGAVFVCKKSSFSRIFNEQIKPNFNNGAEYGHISEYSPKP